MKSSKIVVKSLEITTRNPGPDPLIEYHIEPLTGNKKPAERRQPMANTDEELVHIGLSVADGSMKYDELLQWVRNHE